MKAALRPAVLRSDRCQASRCAAEGDHPFFRPNGEIIFQGVEGKKNYLYKTNMERSRYEKVTSREISTVRSASADREWIMAFTPGEQGHTLHVAIPVSGGEPVILCSGACIAQWSRDGRFFRLRFRRRLQRKKERPSSCRSLQAKCFHPCRRRACDRVPIWRSCPAYVASRMKIWSLPRSPGPTRTSKQLSTRTSIASLSQSERT